MTVSITKLIIFYYLEVHIFVTLKQSKSKVAQSIEIKFIT